MEKGEEIMQYQSNVLECKRKSSVYLKKEAAILILLFLGGVSISRVVLLFNNNIIGIAPFGIAYLLSITTKKNIKNIIVSMLGSCIGYITVIDSISGRYAVILGLIIIMIYSIIAIKVKIIISEKIMFLLVALSFLIFGVINNYNYEVNIALALINVSIVIPVYYIVIYGVKC